jgi:chromosome segregation ATPase
LYEKLKTEGQLSQAGLCKEIYLLKQALEEMKGRCEGLQAELRKAESDLRRKEEELESVLLKNETRVQVLTKRFE